MKRFRAGWSRRRLEADEGEILDIGSGSYPNPAATVLCDNAVEDSSHRHGRALVVDRRLVVGDAVRLPFRTGAFAFVIASHIAEHVEDPAALCAELQRVAVRGYVETPSPLADVLFHEDYHLWRVHRRRGVIEFRRKSPRSPVGARLTDVVYRTFYAGEHECARPVWSLPRGRAGRVLGRGRWVVAGALNRSGILHTRVVFDEARPLRWTVR